MKTIQRSMLVGVACLAASVCGGKALATQQGTPEVMAPASACTIAPLTLPLFGGTPATTLLATPEMARPGALTPADTGTDASVRAGVAEILACLNVGEPKQTYAVFTTGYLARTFGNPAVAYLPAFEQSLDDVPGATPPQYMIQAFEIDGMTSDGRVVISMTVASDGEVWADQLVLAQVDGHWLIDDVLI